jgi:hypothetical protein
VILVAIFVFGVFNVCKGILGDWDQGTYDEADRAYRIHRFPLRPWSEREWQKNKKRQQFRERRPGDEPQYLTEKWQLWIGDDDFLQVKRSRKAVHEGKQGVKVRKRYMKTEGQMEAERGHLAKK